jgi:3-deoxy-D-manno-octulosonic-acid transferase
VIAERLARAAYSLLLRAATPAYLARLWWRGRVEPAYRLHWGERLGLTGDAAPQGRLWLHAVSLGETRAAAPLIAALRERHPGLQLLLTHGTATGREAGRALLRAGDQQAWLPYDTPGAVRRFLRHHRPAAGVVMETEVWPNLLHAAEAARLPMVLASARLSEKSAAQGRRFGALLHPAVARFRAVLAQTEADAARLRAAGARAVQVVGNLKFDMTPAPALLERGRAWRAAAAQPVVLAAATREGEEAPLLAAWAGMPGTRPPLSVVSRNPQRFDEVAALITTAGFSCARRSAWGDGAPQPAEVWLGDSLGEMPAYYAAAQLALLGGSFAPLGGQNLIEAAACGCPLVMGPHTFNFTDAAERALAAGAALRVDTVESAVALAPLLLADGRSERMVPLATAFAAGHRGAADRIAGVVLGLLPPTPGGGRSGQQIER